MSCTSSGLLCMTSAASLKVTPSRLMWFREIRRPPAGKGHSEMALVSNNSGVRRPHHHLWTHVWPQRPAIESHRHLPYPLLSFVLSCHKSFSSLKNRATCWILKKPGHQMRCSPFEKDTPTLHVQTYTVLLKIKSTWFSTWSDAPVLISGSTRHNRSNKDAQVIMPHSVLSHYHYTCMNTNQEDI